MIIVLRPGSLVRKLTPSFSSTAPYLKWVTTKAAPFHLSHNLNPDQLDYERSLVSVLKSCATSTDLRQGRQVHGLVLKSGLDSNIFIGNSLINLYAKCGCTRDAELMFCSRSRLDPVSCNIMIDGYVRIGDLKLARQLFDKMTVKGCVSFTTMIMGLAKSGKLLSAIELFRDMMVEGLVPNEVTMASVISAYAHFGSGSRSGGMLHGLVVRLGIEELVLVSTNLVLLYCTCFRLDDGRALFDQMPDRNIVSWNVMLNGYAKAGRVELARELFEQIPERDVVAWGTIIDGYLQVNRLTEALLLYRKMLHSRQLPNDVMIVDLVSACGRSEAVSEGLQIHNRIIKAGFDSYDFVKATLIHYYAACGQMDSAILQFKLGSQDHLSSWNALMAGFVRNREIKSARKIFDEMPEKDVFSWSIVISGHTQAEEHNEALALFHQMVNSEIRPNEVTMVSVLSAIASLGTLNDAKWAHEYITRSNIPMNDNLYAALIDMYAKCGSFSTSFDLFRQIKHKTFTISPWNAIICGLAMHGHAALSLNIFAELQRRSIKPNSITFIGVLTACCHAGLVEDGKCYFTAMKTIYNIEPNIKHYGCIIDLLGRAGRLEEAENVINTMPMEADVVIWGTLLAACRKHENVKIGERAAQKLAQLDPSHGAGRVLLSNIYIENGRWEDASSVRREIRSQRMERSPAYSGVV
ncbi:hypothetical protein QQ045_010944 [Rhodiola kirilowii]